MINYLVSNLAKNYTKLLITLLFFLFFSPFFNDLVFGIILEIIFFLILIISLQISQFNKQTRIGYFIVIFLSVFSRSKLVLPLFGNEQNIVIIVSSLINGYFLLFTIYLLGQNILKNKKVTSDIVIGGICIYLLIGTFFSVFYRAIYQIDSSAFIISSQQHGSTFDPLYFSFVTLCTVGYGDIIPIAPIAKVLTNIEAMLGVLYPSTAIARLMSLYVAQELKN